MDGARFAYDQVVYPNVISNDTAPDRLAAIGLTRGWRPGDPLSASYLEIGCGAGLNTMAIAVAAPQSRCIGFDLSADAIARGREIAQRAGLFNVTLEVGDILSWPREGEKFDFITTHGVFTWVPKEVRRPLLELIAARLALGGVAYIGYDSLPSAGTKQAINKLLVAETRTLAHPQERIDAGMHLIEVLWRNQRPSSRFKTVLEQLMKEMPNLGPGYFFHDWLAEFYEPISLTELAQEAAKVGLTFAGDSGLHDLRTSDLDADARALLARTGSDLVGRNEVLDLLRGGHSFRADLFVRADAPPPATSAGIRDLSHTFAGKRETVVEDGVSKVRYSAYGRTGSSADPNVHKVLDLMLAFAPAEFTYAELLEQAQLGETELDAVLRNSVFEQLADTHATPQPFVLRPGERPVASPLARALLAHGEETPNLRQTNVTVPEPMSRLLIVLCDGSRDEEALAAAISQAFDTEIPVEKVHEALLHLARLRLFTA